MLIKILAAICMKNWDVDVMGSFQVNPAGIEDNKIVGEIRDREKGNIWSEPHGVLHRRNYLTSMIQY
jgi:hypothetical protein